jgi:hypothetical protein
VQSPQTEPAALRAAEEPEASLPKSSDAESIDIAVAWDRVASSYESSIKFRWLTKAIFAGANQDTVIVQISPSFAGELRSVVGEAGRKDAEAKLGKSLGKKLTLRLEVGEHLIESLPIEVEPAAVAAPQSPKPCEEAARDPAEEFKNDPLIKKALEIFAGEIQTAPK